MTLYNKTMIYLLCLIYVVSILSFTLTARNRIYVREVESVKSELYVAAEAVPFLIGKDFLSHIHNNTTTQKMVDRVSADLHVFVQKTGLSYIYLYEHQSQRLIVASTTNSRTNRNCVSAQVSFIANGVTYEAGVDYDSGELSKRANTRALQHLFDYFALAFIMFLLVIVVFINSKRVEYNIKSQLKDTRTYIKSTI